MKLVRFLDQQMNVRDGLALDEHHARPLTADDGRSPTFDQHPVPIRQFLPPVLPPNIFAVGRNYPAHIQETGARPPQAPLVFQKPTTALIGHRGNVVLPTAAPHEVDFEAELALVIGTEARRVSPEHALDYVDGYTCANDVSARDCQRQDKQWARAKGFDSFCPLGPWLVTSDELDPDHLTIRSRLNGQTMQDANTSQMIFSCRELISYLSHQFTLLPGTVILTGTPHGVGFARTPPVYLRPGDCIEVEIQGIGTLVNYVCDSATPGLDSL